MFGKIIIDMVFVLALVSAGAYFLSLKFGKKFSDIARYSYFAMATGMVTVSAYLLSNIFAHNFQFTYIWSYSSKSLPTHLLFSSFYAGQEGSFLLWSLMLSLIGLFLIPYAKKRGYESYVMGIYSLLLLFLILIIIVKSPFNYIWESFPDQKVDVGFTPPDGRGLNPVLQNYWIAIHPPILFLGYAAMTVPFVFAIAGLFKRDYSGWIYIAIPWTLFASAILGLGIMMGGFWAYETLGWGGFWGWDPVENASLHPWLIAVALVHTMLVQKSTGGLVKTNFALAIFGFVLVLVATYLTRSGILGESSVHSFVDPGQIVNLLLISLLGFFTLFSYGLLLFRLKQFPIAKLSFKSSSKEMWLALGSILLLALTIIVLIGTLRPVMPEFLVKTKATVPSSDFNKWALPLTLLILVLNAVSIYLNWKQTNWMQVLKKLYLPIALSIVALIVSIFMGAKSWDLLFLGFTGWFSLFVNIELLIKNITTNPKRIGAFLSHLGLSALVLGVIASGGYQETKPLSLYFNKPKDALGYKFTLLNKERVEKERTDVERYAYNLKVEKDGETKAIINPVIYWSSFNSFESPYYEPGIERFAIKDLYISPKTYDYEKYEPFTVLGKGESCKVPSDTSISMKLLGFDMSHVSMSQSDGNHFKLGVVVEFNNSKKVWIDTVFSIMGTEEQSLNPTPKDIPGADVQVNFTKLITAENMEDTKAEFIFGKEVFHIDATIKPFINLVWFGVIAIVIGFVMSIARHLSINKKEKLKESQHNENLTTESVNSQE